MLLLTKENVVDAANLYGEIALLTRGGKGKFTATVFMVEGAYLLYRFTPGTRLTERQFGLWFPDFSAPELEVDTASVTLYQGEGFTGWSVQEHRKYFQTQLEKLVSYLDGIETGTFFI